MDLRYPIGKYEPLEYSKGTKEDWLGAIRFCRSWWKMPSTT